VIGEWEGAVARRLWLVARFDADDSFFVLRSSLFFSAFLLSSFLLPDTPRNYTKLKVPKLPKVPKVSSGADTGDW
jgi:hypothetical protein